MKKYIIFDVMGVIFIVGDDTNELLIPYIRKFKPEMSQKKLQQLYMDASFGYISAYDFWIAASFSPDEVIDIQNNYLDTCLTLDSEFPACVKELKKKYKIALLSNDVSEWNAHLRGRHNLEQYIDFAFISSDIGARKPSSEIYLYALNKMGANPSECIFIDDDPKRVDAASELGIASILFNRSNVNYNGIQIRSFQELERIL